ncbi:hypothetical protein MHF_0746 [Mycoplasma haemofelis Ohio2]|uniref:Uncharacterized protein n=1 Tax=Mycoplasma haemofelis (strain Ohio2) TaxID=859194 RepID=F6FIG8_MYCHI|nr:hypothetical protein MHF_0746 [Mycoplasma haemofelis Ohio2]
MEFSKLFLGGALLGASGLIGAYFDVFPRWDDLSRESISTLRGGEEPVKVSQLVEQSAPTSEVTSTTTSEEGASTKSKGNAFAVKSSWYRYVVKVDDKFLKENLTADVYEEVTKLLETKSQVFVSKDYWTSRWVYQDWKQDWYKDYKLHSKLYGW